VSQFDFSEFETMQPIMATLLPCGGAPPMLQNSTTLVTEVLDLALVAPMAVVAGPLIHRRRWRALVLAVPLLVVLAFAIVARPATRGPLTQTDTIAIDFDLPVPSETIACR